MPEKSKVDDQQSADFSRRGTILRDRREEKTGNCSEDAAVSDKKSGMSSGTHDRKGHPVYFSPWAIIG